jgi:hypothetical protein
VIVEMLVGAGKMVDWPVSDFLHLLKNVRMQLAGNEIADGRGGAPFSAKSLNKHLGTLPGLRDTRASTAQRDADALQLVQPEVIAKCFAGDERSAARYLLPWTLLMIVIREPAVSREARLQLLTIAFAIFYTSAKELRKLKGVGLRKASKTDERPLAFADGNRLKRACNLCIALYYAIDHYGEHGLILGRIGTHDCETHFGTIRAILRGHTRFDGWVSAEAFARMMDAFINDVGLVRRPRDGRTVAGCTIPALAEERGLSLAEPINERSARLVVWARGFARCDYEMTNALWERLREWLLSLPYGGKPYELRTGPFQGMICHCRQFLDGSYKV